MILIALDTETTGMKADDDICEFAWAELDSDLNVVREAGSLIKPSCPISHGAAGVHGITDDDVINAPSLPEWLASHAHPFEEKDILAIGHNINFDLRYLGRYIEFSGSLCTLKLSRHLYPDVENHKMQTLRHYLGIKVDASAHSASGDVRVLVAVLKRMVEDSGMSLGEMIEVTNKPSVVAKMPFGKHKGKSLNALPEEYRAWLLSLPDLSDDLRHSLLRIS